MVVKWTFDNGVNTYTFEFNPSDPVEPAYKRNLVFENGLGVGGNTLMLERQKVPQQINWSGSILTQTEYEGFQTWFSNGGAITITDDLGRQFLGTLTEFTPKRVYSYANPWYHTYTAAATLSQFWSP